MILSRPGRLRMLARRAFIATLFLFVYAAPSRAAPAGADLPDKEHRIKAVFLYRFAQFVEWPSDSFAGEGAPLVLGILGPDPFGAYLDEVVQGEKVGSHPIIIKRAATPAEAAECHVLFISPAGSGPDAAGAISALKGRSVLTVGETESFSQGGGMIRFITRNGRIRLRIDMDAVRAAHLQLSSKLLRLAETTPTDKE